MARSLSLLPPPRQWPRSAWWLVAANAVPLWGVFALDWDAAALLWLYWLENLVIGAFAALRIGAARGAVQPGHARAFLIPFFIVHFGLFCMGHGMVLTFLADPGGGDPFEALTSFAGVKAIPGAGWAVLALLLSHGYSFVANFLLRGESRHTTPQEEMLRPYARILVMHLTVLVGGALMLFLQAPAAALAVLTLIKTALDLAAHLRERRQSAAAAPTSAPAPE